VDIDAILADVDLDLDRVRDQLLADDLRRALAERYPGQTIGREWQCRWPGCTRPESGGGDDYLRHYCELEHRATERERRYAIARSRKQREELRRAPVKASYTIVAHDGDHDDIGTTYFLLDDQAEPVSSSAWPQPLERLCADLGVVWRRAASRDGAERT
jgi:hypothetical protein